MDNNQIINETLIEFWNKALAMEEGEIESTKVALENVDYRTFAPSEKLLYAAQMLGKCNKVLDYGCGNGWASIIAAKSGCKDVTAVDMGEEIIKTANVYIEAFGVQDRINAVAGSMDWLSNAPERQYDGLICSNVLDVVPTETAKAILEGLSRVATPKAILVIGLNYFIPEDVIEAKGIKLENGDCLFIDGVLRMVNRSDEEWKSMFEPYFDVEGLDYFAWPNEKNETRRLFTLRKH